MRVCNIQVMWGTIMRRLIKGFLMITVMGSLVSIGGCAPEVGSEAWCEELKEKSKGEWTANETGDFAKHCVFK